MANNALARGGLISVGLAGVLCALVAQAAGESYVVPGSKAATLESCVEPTDFMRRNHMEVIKHQRDETVHSGIRSTKHSLAGCIECHVSVGENGVSIAVNGEKQFCSACHRYVAVGMNCFGCHANIPRVPDENATIPGASGSLAPHPTLGDPLPSGADPRSAAGREGDKL